MVVVPYFQSGIRSVVYNVIKQLMYASTRKNVIGEMLDGHSSIKPGSFAAASKLSDSTLPLVKYGIHRKLLESKMETF